MLVYILLFTNVLGDVLAIYTGWAKKSRPLRLTVYIFNTSESICVIFGTLRYCFVLNTSVKSITNL